MIQDPIPESSNATTSRARERERARELFLFFPLLVISLLHLLLNDLICNLIASAAVYLLANMDSRTLGIIGGGWRARLLAQAAHRYGLRTVVLDPGTPI